MPSAGQPTAMLEANALCLRFGAVDDGTMEFSNPAPSKQVSRATVA